MIGLAVVTHITVFTMKKRKKWHLVATRYFARDLHERNIDLKIMNTK